MLKKGSFKEEDEIEKRFSEFYHIFVVGVFVMFGAGVVVVVVVVSVTAALVYI